MLRARTLPNVAKARQAIGRVGKLSDNIVSIGPVGIGIDGLLAWAPGLGDLYSLAAGGALILLGLRARAPVMALVKAFLLIGLRTAIGAAAIPLLGPIYPISGAVVDLFRGHKMAADLLAKAIDQIHYVEGPRRDFDQEPDLQAAVAAARLRGEWIVFLG